ncbi:MAG: alpha/beta fold hydrolase [bacterium]|nr:MAG: alpha/beta fold hydrolase [bacterium]
MKFLVRKMIYPGSLVAVPDSPPSPLLQLRLTVSENVNIQAWYFIKNPEFPFVLYFHGNGENLQTVWLSGVMGQFRQFDINFMAIDYPGYGRSEGTPHESTLLQSAAKSVDWIVDTYPASKIVLCGWSLGAAVALLTGKRYPESVHGLIALSAWTSLEDVARKHYPDWLVKHFLNEKYASFEVAAQLNQAVLLIHGAEDTIIPAAHSQQLAPKFPALREYLLIEGAHHNDLLGYPEVWGSIERFLDTFRQ